MVLIGIKKGEVHDRMSILAIKTEKLDGEKRRQAASELSDLVERMPDLDMPLYAMLKNVNSELWDVEDRIRACEARKDFGDEFVSLARAIYILNDQRSSLKAAIDEKFGDRPEVKEYVDYGEVKR